MKRKTFSWDWSLKDLKKTEGHGSKVFSTFACGGGSTMGYKLAGYDVLGCNEIDPRMIELYKKNLNPKIVIPGDIRSLHGMKLPKELYHLDLLDGSPPCSTFSISGNRERDWGRKKKFTEGQQEQTLDDLFFEFIKLGKELQPKIIMAENVKGIVMGRAATYVSQIYRDLDEAGYEVQHWLMNSSRMGVPQIRERIFFIALRKDLVKKVPALDLNVFNQRPISYSEIEEVNPPQVRTITPAAKELWERSRWGSDFSKAHANGTSFTQRRAHPDKPLHTLTTQISGKYFHYNDPREISDLELIRGNTFPKDYDFGGLQVQYVTGMSVPPVMLAGIAQEIYFQWLTRL